jgi:hypothetical protein
MITINPAFLNYIQRLREELQKDPTTFIPPKKNKYSPEHYQKHKEQYKARYRRHMEKKKNAFGVVGLQ